MAAGQTKDLDIDFSTCESIVAQGNGQYRRKPVLHAGEVSTTSTSINGKILDIGQALSVGAARRVYRTRSSSTRKRHFSISKAALLNIEQPSRPPSPRYLWMALAKGKRSGAADYRCADRRSKRAAAISLLANLRCIR